MFTKPLAWRRYRKQKKAAQRSRSGEPFVIETHRYPAPACPKQQLHGMSVDDTGVLGRDNHAVAYRCFTGAHIGHAVDTHQAVGAVATGAGHTARASILVGMGEMADAVVPQRDRQAGVRAAGQGLAVDRDGDCFNTRCGGWILGQRKILSRTGFSGTDRTGSGSKVGSAGGCGKPSVEEFFRGENRCTDEQYILYL